MSAPFVTIDLARIADVLDAMARETETLGQILCSDPELVASYMGQLQEFDRIAQHQKGLASLLRADCPTTALGQLGLEELANKISGR